jgi:hypothetical protein
MKNVGFDKVTVEPFVFIKSGKPVITIHATYYDLTDEEKTLALDIILKHIDLVKVV